MRTLSILAAAATALIATAGMAQAPGQRQFTRDGHTYVYSTSAAPNGKVLIAGREVGSATRFRLLVDGDRVSGYSNGYPVSFRAPAGSTIASIAAN